MQILIFTGFEFHDIPPMKVILFLYFFILANTLFAQDSFITISGRVTDIEDQTPLPFASIGLKGTSLGTITNTQGEFDFHIPAGLKDGTMVISMLGYKDLAESVQNLDPDNLNSFNLSKEATMLREVVILDSLAGGEILQIALNSIEKNYPMKPYSMDGFYRDLKKVNGKYISVLEAAVNIYDKDYSSPRNPFKLRERVSLVEVRKSLNYEFEFNKYFDQYNLLEELLLENNVKYRSFTDNPLFFQNITREGKNSMGGRTLYELKLRGDHGYFLHLFIDTETYGIHKMIYRYGDGTIALQEINRSGKRVEKIMKMEKVIEFKEFEGKLYLKYLKVKTFYDWVNRNTGKLEAKTELDQMLLINQVKITNLQWISTGKKMKRYGLQYQDLPYNKVFWDRYNVIKDTPLDQEIVKDLEKYVDLNAQFQNR